MSDHKLTELKPRRLSRYSYRGFRIEQEAVDLYAIRFHQRNPSIIQDYKPWCESVEEAQRVIDKMIARAEAEEAKQ